MEKKPQKERNKPRFCYDVNAQFKYLNKECNKYAMFTSSARLLGKNTASDEEIIQFCIDNHYHVITHNKVNFKDYRKPTPLGIVYLGQQNKRFWLNKFKFFMKSNSHHKDLEYKTVVIDNNRITSVIDRRLK